MEKLESSMVREWIRMEGRTLPNAEIDEEELAKASYPVRLTDVLAAFVQLRSMTVTMEEFANTWVRLFDTLVEMEYANGANEEVPLVPRLEGDVLLKVAEKIRCEVYTTPGDTLLSAQMLDGWNDEVVSFLYNQDKMVRDCRFSAEFMREVLMNVDPFALVRTEKQPNEGKQVWEKRGTEILIQPFRSTTDLELVRVFAEQLKENGDPAGLSFVGYGSLNGNAVFPKDTVLAEDCLLRYYSKTGSDGAAQTLGFLAYQGTNHDGVCQDAAAFRFLSVAALAGRPDAAIPLADLFMKGKGVQKNRELGIRLLMDTYKKQARLFYGGIPSTQFADAAQRLGDITLESASGIEATAAGDVQEIFRAMGGDYGEDYATDEEFLEREALRFYLEADLMMRNGENGIEGNAFLPESKERTDRYLALQRSLHALREKLDEAKKEISSVYPTALEAPVTGGHTARMKVKTLANGRISLVASRYEDGNDFPLVIPEFAYAGWEKDVTVHPEKLREYRILLGGEDSFAYDRMEMELMEFDDGFDDAVTFYLGDVMTAWVVAASFHLKRKKKMTAPAPKKGTHKVAHMRLSHNGQEMDFLCDGVEVLGRYAIVTMNGTDYMAQLLSIDTVCEKELPADLPVIRRFLEA